MSEPKAIPSSSRLPTRFEHYELLRHTDGSIWELGRGAMGVTYKALDTRLHHHVALKVISADLTGYPAARERFLREARTAARLHHANIARVFHLGETSGGTEAFYAMEFVDGETLEARVRRVGPLSVWLTLEVGIEVARALVAACHQRLIHRDLKPANLMLVASAEAATLAAVGSDSSHGESDEAWVKIIDFGLAKAAAEVGPLTGAGEFVGTPQYASPEQFSGSLDRVDGRSDIYSLGATLRFALTATAPFSGNAFTQVHTQKLSPAFPTGQLAAFAVPVSLVRLLTAMLAVDPGDRPQTPSILLEALRRCREELRAQVSAPPNSRTLDPSPWHLRRLFKRRRMYQALLGYAVGAWVVSWAAAFLSPRLGWPGWTLRALTVLLAAGCGEALLLGWALERRAAGKALLPQRTAGRLKVALLVLAPVALAGVFFFRHPQDLLTAARVKNLAAAGDAIPSPPPVAPVPEKSIAVLPFANLSADPNEAYFADGVQDEILTNLSKVADLKVISRTSVMQYKSGEPRNVRDIAAQLGVAHILEGTVQRAGNQIRVTAQLIDAQTDAHLWAERYDRPLDDIFAIQSEIAQTIAGQLQTRLSPEEKTAMSAPPTTDFLAYNLYLRAESLCEFVSDPGRGNVKMAQAVTVLQEALEHDLSFLSAWGLLARTDCQLYFLGHDHTPARLEQARAAAEAAVRLRPDAGEAHLALGLYYYYGFRDYDKALSELDLARRTSPNEAVVFAYIGYINRRLGRWEESMRNVERSLELDPRNFATISQLVGIQEWRHHYAEAIRLCDRALAIVPGDPYIRTERAEIELDWRADVRPVQVNLALLTREDSQLAAGCDDPTAAFCERTPEAWERALGHCPPEGLVTSGTSGVKRPRAFFEGEVARYEGDRKRALAAFTAARVEVAKVMAEQPDFAHELAVLGVIDAALGRRQEAIAEGRRACEMLPLSKDALDGSLIGFDMATIYAWVGDKDAAIDQLIDAEQQPNTTGYGDLKLHPRWDSLRGDPRFEALVASLAPEKDKEF